MTVAYHMRSLMMACLLVLTSSTLATARTWHVPADAPTIQAGIDSAGVGDDVLVSAGVYEEADITMQVGIWVHSEEGPEATVIDAGGSGRVFNCRNLEQTATIEGFEMRNGHVTYDDGGALRCSNSRVAIRDCVITDCTADGGPGGGIYAGWSDLVVETCKVIRCSATGGGGICGYHSSVTIANSDILQNESNASVGGIFAYGPEVTIVGSVVSENVAWWGSPSGIGCASPALMIRDCLITRNAAYTMGGCALEVYEGAGSIAGCTVADNTGSPDPGEGICIGRQSSVQIDRTIIAFHEGGGLWCSDGSDVAVGCCDCYGNDGGNDICGTDLGGNFSADPLFCDAEEGDYTLDGCSPCLPDNHPDGVDCGLIGALGQGCGATAIEETSWGCIKSLYRR